MTVGQAPELLGVHRYQPGFTVVGVHTPEFEFERYPRVARRRGALPEAVIER